MKKLGRMRIAEPIATGVAGNQMLSGHADQSEQHYETSLLAEHEIEHLFERDENRMLILGAGRPPAVAERFIYHDKKDPLFKGLYD